VKHKCAKGEGCCGVRNRDTGNRTWECRPLCGDDDDEDCCDRGLDGYGNYWDWWWGEQPGTDTAIMKPSWCDKT